ncbi:helix-turn-helix domain-containing protein [Streptomyces sp. NBC_01620]|uniref:helix-turn-helix domain-containing protein n=1 Tax=Streptomyces sp. NBC_01620 TaxID=2975902 RepID=UPI00386E7283|nr:helix-turn-helix domain-containing protein [Streptomyces sp. NBC_01620]
MLPSREALGYSRKKLSEVAGVSEKSIQVAEEGRTPRARWPQSLSLIEEALGWRRGCMVHILEGDNLPLPLFPESEKPRRPRIRSGPDEEMFQAGVTAEAMFVRQMRRRRRALGLLPDDFAERVAGLGGDMTGRRVREIESGLRPLRPEEADLIAKALDVDVERLLSSAFTGSDEEMKAPPTEEELTAEAKALERRIADAGAEVNLAVRSVATAKERLAVEEAMWQREVARKADLEHQYHYLLGRIDALRASRGDEEVIQVKMQTRED